MRKLITIAAAVPLALGLSLATASAETIIIKKHSDDGFHRDRDSRGDRGYHHRMRDDDVTGSTTKRVIIKRDGPVTTKKVIRSDDD